MPPWFGSPQRVTLLARDLTNVAARLVGVAARVARCRGVGAPGPLCGYALGRIVIVDEARGDELVGRLATLDPVLQGLQDVVLSGVHVPVASSAWIE